MTKEIEDSGGQAAAIAALRDRILAQKNLATDYAVRLAVTEVMMERKKTQAMRKLPDALVFIIEMLRKLPEGEKHAPIIFSAYKGLMDVLAKTQYPLAPRVTDAALKSILCFSESVDAIVTGMERSSGGDAALRASAVKNLRAVQSCCAQHMPAALRGYDPTVAVSLH